MRAPQGKKSREISRTAEDPQEKGKSPLEKKERGLVGRL